MGRTKTPAQLLHDALQIHGKDPRRFHEEAERIRSQVYPDHPWKRGRPSVKHDLLTIFPLLWPKRPKSWHTINWLISETQKYQDNRRKDSLKEQWDGPTAPKTPRVAEAQTIRKYAEPWLLEQDRCPVSWQRAAIPSAVRPEHDEEVRMVKEKLREEPGEKQPLLDYLQARRDDVHAKPVVRLAYKILLTDLHDALQP